ncbi:MAG TPA: tetratricopeptide repeat protein, partial [Polyangiaceae bacterium]|nr:tetratricopeptide repeat protein [Polyangiaceae bacterium]
LSELARGFDRYADALTERAGSTFDPDIARELFVRLGRISEQRLEDPNRAIAAYVRAVDQAGDQPELLEALDRLYSAAGDYEALAEILERRVVIETSDERRGELQYRLAVIQAREFKEPARALASLRAALDVAPTHEGAIEELEKLTELADLFDEAAEALENVYRAQNRAESLARLYEKRVAYADSPEARVDMRKNLALVLEQESQNPRAAQGVIEQGLLDAPEDAGLLDEVERLAAITGDWRSAAEALERAVAAHPELSPESAVALCMRLSNWLSERASDVPGAERALNIALEHDPGNDEVLARLEQLQQGSGRERDLLQTLRRRARLQIDDEQRESLYRRAKDLADSLGDGQAAETVLRELLALDDTNLWALESLTLLRERAGDYPETFALVVRQSEIRSDAEGVRALRRRAAELSRDKLGDARRAVEFFEQLFEEDPADQASAQALEVLYPQLGSFQELSRLYERQIEVATTPAARSALRLELARLNQDKFGAVESAIENLRAVLEEEPAHELAVSRLGALLEAGGRDEELAELLNGQIEQAQSRGDVASELGFQVRLGEIYEQRLGDTARAIDTYKSVLQRDPQHHGALEALSRLLRKDGDLAECARVLSQLLNMESGEAAVKRSLELADVFDALDQPSDAAEALERGLATGPRSPDLYRRLQAAYEKLGRWDKLSDLLARKASEEASPDEAVRLLREASQITARKRSDPVHAAELLERAAQLRPDNRELLLELCDRYSAAGRGREAARVLEKIVANQGPKRTKELGEIHRRLAAAYLGEGEIHKAVEELDKAFRIEPGNLQVLTQLGEVAMKVGDYKKAQQMYRALLLQKLDDSSAIKKSVVFLRLGEIHEALGEKPKAAQMYERAVQTDGLDEAKAKLKALQ